MIVYYIAEGTYRGQFPSAIEKGGCHMKKELDFFTVGNDYGFDQDKFTGVVMKIGGCAAVTACDSFIYIKKYKNIESLYPYDASNVTKEDYIAFSNVIKPYLHPRMSGIDSLEIYIGGVNAYLADIGENRLKLSGFSGNESAESAEKFIISQIDGGYPIPCLVLRHSNPVLKDYVWHWFLITGYEVFGDTAMVKIVSYGEYMWLSLDALWNTGYSRRGGLIKFTLL